MGWFWQDNALSPKPTSAPAASSPPSDTPTPQAQTPPPEPPAAPMSTEDKELASFLAMLHADTSKSSSTNPSNRQSSPTSSSSRSSRAPNRPSPASAAINEAILPSTMSCRDAFDYAWHCNTPGAQWNSVYRYGSVRSCSDLWDDFWLCMRTRQYSPEHRAQVIRAHYRERQDAKYYAPGQPSSEDVWESRDRLVEPGTAFQVAFDDPRESDTEWNLKEIERRRRIREQTFGKES